LADASQKTSRSDLRIYLKTKFSKYLTGHSVRLLLIERIIAYPSIKKNVKILFIRVLFPLFEKQVLFSKHILKAKFKPPKPTCQHRGFTYFASLR
jgi:hypothetical protein